MHIDTKPRMVVTLSGLYIHYHNAYGYGTWQDVNVK